MRCFHEIFSKKAWEWILIISTLVQAWHEKFSLAKKIFRQINSLAISLVKTLLSRNFCRTGIFTKKWSFHRKLYELRKMNWKWFIFWFQVAELLKETLGNRDAAFITKLTLVGVLAEPSLSSHRLKALRQLLKSLFDANERVNEACQNAIISEILLHLDSG